MEPVGTRPEGNRRRLGQGLLFVLEKLSKCSNLKSPFFLPAQGVPSGWGGGDLSQEALVALEEVATGSFLVPHRRCLGCKCLYLLYESVGLDEWFSHPFKA